MSGNESYENRLESYGAKPDIRERLIRSSPGHISDADLLGLVRPYVVHPRQVLPEAILDRAGAISN